MKLFYNVYFFVFCLIYHFSSQRICKHVFHEPNQFSHSQTIPKLLHLTKRDLTSDGIKIGIHYDEYTFSKLGINENNLVKNRLIPEAILFWSKALRVRNPLKKILLSRTCYSKHIYYLKNNPKFYCKDDCNNRTFCGDVEIPNYHLDKCRVYKNNRFFESGIEGSGINGKDFILYVSVKETTKCSIKDTVAYAAHCHQDFANDRPISGYVNLCPSSLSSSTHKMHILLSTVRHEMLHALGFSASLFAYFRDENGNPLTERDNSTGKPKVLNTVLSVYQWSEKIIRNYTYNNWEVRSKLLKKHVKLVVTPNVVNEVRKHFNCNKLIGAELEDQGEIGTSLTHWEKRIFEHEAMTGIYTQNPVISRITFAFMQDTGWYDVNYEYAEDLKWGKNLGCNFAMKSCLSWIQTNELANLTIYPYCNMVKEKNVITECDEKRQSVVMCNIMKYKNQLASQYQNFLNIPNIKSNEIAYYGGSVYLSDYCPFYQEFDWNTNGIFGRTSDCTLPENNLNNINNYLLEIYGNQSICLQNLKNESWITKNCNSGAIYPVNHLGSACYQYNCDTNTGLMITFWENNVVQCQTNGQIIRVEEIFNGWLHKGNIICPKCEEICGEKCPKKFIANITDKLITNNYKCKSTAINFVSIIRVTNYQLLFYIFNGFVRVFKFC